MLQVRRVAPSDTYGLMMAQTGQRQNEGLREEIPLSSEEQIGSVAREVCIRNQDRRHQCAGGEGGPVAMRTKRGAGHTIVTIAEMFTKPGGIQYLCGTAWGCSDFLAGLPVPNGGMLR